MCLLARTFFGKYDVTWRLSLFINAFACTRSNIIKYFLRICFTPFFAHWFACQPKFKRSLLMHMFDLYTASSVFLNQSVNFLSY